MESLKRFLTSYYEIGGDITLKLHEAGFLSTNHILETTNGKFFLKCYRFSEKEKIVEIHAVKSFFASHGIPVILPIEKRGGGTFFTFEEKHYALFPFIDGIHYTRGFIPSRQIILLGEFLAKMHKIGAECDFKVHAGFKDKGTVTFLKIAKSIEAIIEAKEVKSNFDQLALESLRLKVNEINKYPENADMLITEAPILLHGDFQEQNMFFDERGNIKNIFDFEQTIIGPRNYELWRSADLMFLNGEFDDKGISDVIQYFRAYNEKNNIRREDLALGLEIYCCRQIRSLWIEQEHYLKGSNRVDLFLERRNKCIRYLAQNKDVFLERILEGVYGKQKTA